jgi:hypothetical protein
MPRLSAASFHQQNHRQIVRRKQKPIKTTELIYRNTFLIDSAEYAHSKIIRRIVMSSAAQAFVMTAVLFGLSFGAIFLFWFAEKFRPIRGPKIPR